tara:strand:+ start:904 stop:1374 length:471 start_codon:yes stop_codon:yes gene_type:complete
MKPKIPAQKVMSDDCSISVGQVVEDGEIVNAGTPHFIHQGEWVEVLPVMTVKEVMQISRLQNAGADGSQLGENLTDLCRELSRRVISWNWTDLMGEPMEQPYNRPDVLEGLSSEELMWLMSATGGGDSADARKKDSAKSESISLATESSQAMLPSE